MRFTVSFCLNSVLTFEAMNVFGHLRLLIDTARTLPLLYNPTQGIFTFIPVFKMFRDNLNGIATLYGLDGFGIESRWWEIFCTRPERL
jgi:hypothetical protein